MINQAAKQPIYALSQADIEMLAQDFEKASDMFAHTTTMIELIRASQENHTILDGLCETLIQACYMKSLDSAASAQVMKKLLAKQWQRAPLIRP